MTEEYFSDISGICRSFELRILEDTVKHEWSKHVYILPPLWKDVVSKSRLYFAGMINTSEIVLFHCYSYLNPCVFYYNIETSTIIFFLNHVENVKLFQAV